MVDLILDAGVQYSGGWAERFAYIAVQFEQVDILRLLLERNIGSARFKELSAVNLAIRQGSLPLTEPFIEYGSVTRRQAVEMAIILGNLEVVQALTEMSQPAPELSVLVDDAKSSAYHGHFESVKYFLELIRQKDASQVQVAALAVFRISTTAPILEFCMPLTNGIYVSLDDVLQRALSRGYTETADFLIRHGATYDRNDVDNLFGLTVSESHFLCLWNLRGGTSNFSVLMHEILTDGCGSHKQSLVYIAIVKGYWNVLETCLRYPDFKMEKSANNVMRRPFGRAVKDEQEKLLWHIVEHVPEARPILLKGMALPIPRSPALLRILNRCRELLLPTIETPALRWEMSALSDVFFNLIVHSKLRLMEAVVAPIGLDSETQTAAVAALRRICLLTMKLMADGNQDASLMQDLRQELVTCAALPGCDTIPKYFAHTICTEALERNEQVLFAVIRDALTGPSYPDGGVFYADDTLKRHWLTIAVQQGLHDVVRSLVPSSPAENADLHQSNARSPKCSISIRDKPLWQSAVNRAIDDGDHAILELLIQTQYTISGYDANELAIILLQPAFIANDHALLRTFRGMGLIFPLLDFSYVFLPALYHDLNPEKCTCAMINHHDANSKQELAHASMESICIFLGISDTNSDLGASNINEGKRKHKCMLLADPTFVPRPNEWTRMSCQGSQHIAANYCTLFFNRAGHAMCGGCLEDRFTDYTLNFLSVCKRAKRDRSRDVGGNNGIADKTSTDIIRVGCTPSYSCERAEGIFLVTPSLQQVPPQDAELFLSQDDTYDYFDDCRRINNRDRRYQSWQIANTSAF